MAGIFKAYDLRGVYPGELDEAIATKIGVAAEVLFEGKNIAVGRDMRISGESLSGALIRGLSAWGANVIDVGLISTPMINFTVASYGYDGGIQVTASHNTKEYNGFKLCRSEARPIGWDTGIEALEAKVATIGAIPDAAGSVVRRDALPDYVGHVLSFAKNISGLKIAIDASSGMAGLTMPHILKGLDVNAVRLNFKLDGTFPVHEANPLKAENLKQLQAAVTSEGADLGMEYDGDADRVAFVDETGEIIPCDLIIALLAKEALKANPGAAVLYDVRSSWAVREEIEACGGVPVRGRVGHSFMKQLLRDTDGILGGELSGHYYFRENFYCDDGAIAMVKVLNLLCQEQRPLSELIAPLKRYSQSGEINFEVEDKAGKIAELKSTFAHGRIDETDGLTVEFDDRWFNVRPSNTEPALRLNVEGKTNNGMEELRDQVAGMMAG